MRVQLAEVSRLVKQLSDLGYHSYQVDDILRDSVGTSKIDSLSSEQLQLLAAELQDHISFAIRCKGKKC